MKVNVYFTEFFFHGCLWKYEVEVTLRWGTSRWHFMTTLLACLESRSSWKEWTERDAWPGSSLFKLQIGNGFNLLSTFYSALTTAHTFRVNLLMTAMEFSERLMSWISLKKILMSYLNMIIYFKHLNEPIRLNSLLVVLLFWFRCAQYKLFVIDSTSL